MEVSDRMENLSAKQYRVAIVGATGAVGRMMVRILQERNFPVSELKLLASGGSAGLKIPFGDREISVEPLDDSSVAGHDFVLMSAGAAVAREWAPKFVETGAVVIDNSPAFRMEEEVPLVVPEINPADAHEHKGIISNPNCATIAFTVALNRLHRSFKVKRVIITSLQSVSGAGREAEEELRTQAGDFLADKDMEVKVLGKRIAFNLVPQIGDFLKEGATEEEEKIAQESGKILHDPSIGISVTCVRVPVFVGHSLSLNVETLYPSPPVRVMQVLQKAQGVKVVEDPGFPMPIDTENCDTVFVGRIREDMTAAHAFNMWVVSNNLRKGAATNAVQIVEILTAPPKEA